jgi:hypothetical protein
MITPLVSFDHCVVCPSIYRLWLPLWYLLTIVLSVLLRFTDSDYPFGIFWPMCCLSFFDLQIMITPLVSFDQCVVRPSWIYIFWLPLWYLLTIVLSVLLRFTAYDYPFGIFWPLCCLSFFDLQIIITPLVSFDQCVVCPSSIYRLWLPLWYLLTNVLSVLRFTDYDYPFGVFWPMCCLSFFDLQIMITPLVSFDHCVVCPSSIYRLWLLLWYLLTIVVSVLLRFTDYDYPFGIFWPLCCLSFFDLQIMITPLVSFDHCGVCPSIYRFWLPLWYLLTIVLSVLRFTDYHYPFGIFWPLWCLSFDLQIMITPLVSFDHCGVCPSIYKLWLLLWYLLTIVVSVLLRFTDYDYLFGIFWPLCCLTFFDLQIMITPLVSFDHCVVCPSSIYRLWLLLWYLLTIVLSVLLGFTYSDYSFGIFWPLWCLSFFDLEIMITLFGIFWPLWCLSFFDLQTMITPLVSSNSS